MFDCVIGISNPEYDYRLSLAIDELDKQLQLLEGDYDIHNIIQTIAKQFDVQKSDLLEFYDSL